MAMTVNEFIAIIAPIAVADWKKRRIMLPSVVIAQGIKEGNKGNSELAVNANAIFGIKLNGWTGKSYTKKADEQNPDGTMRTDEDCLWRAYDSWEESVVDHNTYIAERKVLESQKKPNFHSIIGETNVKKVIAGLIGNKNRLEVAARCTDPELREYVLAGTTEYGYATDLNYAQSLLDDYIIKYNLTQYDIIEEEPTMSDLPIFALDAGHGYYTAGKRCLKAIDPNETREWYLNDRIMDKVEVKLKAYECKTIRVDDTTGAKDISLSNRARTANNAGAKAYIAMHHNAGLKGKKVIGGLMVFYGLLTEARHYQTLDLYNEIQKHTGLPVNPDRARVVYERFTVLTKTKMPAFLVENGFMDSQIDVPIILTEAHAEKTANGVVSFLVKEYDLKKKKASQIATDKATGTTYTVVKGDTLSKIGTKFGVAWKDIAAANGIRAPYTINIGKVLTIPGAKTESIYYPAYTGKTVTLSAALASLDIDSSYGFRKKIAAANGIKGYIGTAAQNTSMYNLLKAGLLKKA